MKLSFEIGEYEKHRVEFSWSQIWGGLRIALDGHVVRRDIRIASPIVWEGREAERLQKKWNVLGSRFAVQLIHRWALEVGSKERHEVIIEKERARMLAGCRPQKYRVFVDGLLVLERSGY